LPDRPAEVAPFLAGMDDQQARATLARLLEERTREPKPERGREMLMDLEHASGMLGGRLRNITEAKADVAAAPRIYWQWLTGNGADPIAPLRATAWGALLVVFAWLAQVAAGALATRASGRWETASPVARRRLAAATMPFRWIVFLGAGTATHALVPEVTRPSHLTALAILLSFAGTWIGSRVISVVLPASFGTARPAESAGCGPGFSTWH
jgi:hypothetical protein